MRKPPDAHDDNGDPPSPSRPSGEGAAGKASAQGAIAQALESATLAIMKEDQNFAYNIKMVAEEKESWAPISRRITVYNKKVSVLLAVKLVDWVEPRPAPVWVGYASLVCGAVSVLLLGLVLGSSTTRQPDQTGVQDSSSKLLGKAVAWPPPEEKRILLEEIKGAVKEASPRPVPGPALAVAEKNQLLEGIKATVKEVLTPPRPDPTLAEAEKKKLLEEIKGAVKEATPKPPSGPALSEAEKKRLLEEIRATVKDAGPKPPSGPLLSDVEKKRLLDDIKGAVKETIPKAPASDLYLVITHTAAMDAGQYTEALRKALTQVVPRGKDVPVRVGLAVASNDVLTPKVALEDPQVKLDSFGEAASEDRESPHSFGRALKNLFPQDRVKQRAVLVVTAGCSPLLPDQEGWNQLSEVHVVVIARKELGPADWERLGKWHKFAESRSGSVHLIGNPADVRRQNEFLFAWLSRLIRLPE